MNKFNLGTVWILLFFWLTWPPSATCAVNPGNHLPGTLRVGVMDLPPFTMQNSSGECEGLGCDLLYAIAKELDVRLAFVPYDNTDQMQADLINEKLDLVPVVIVSAANEQRVDLSNAYYQSGSVIVTHAGDNGRQVMRFFKALLSLFFPKIVGLLFMMWLVAGVLVWLFEKRHNTAMFGERFFSGLGHGIWWAAVTMTTVGYGDKAPKTVGGRIVAVIWMFTSIILISMFTATATTSLTIEELKGKVQGFRDLPHVRVGTLKGTQQVDYLAKAGIHVKTYESIKDGLKAVSEKELDAFVQDEAIVKYLVKKDFLKSLRILPEIFDKRYVSMAIPEGSILREPLNRALLKVTEKDQWKDLLQRYLGPGK